jgi:hypothetical protein
MKILFAKYNRGRLPKFQTVTKIIELANGEQKAIKQSLMIEAKQHIAEIYANYKRLVDKYPHIKLVSPILENNDSVIFTMATGISLDSLLKQALDKQDKNTFVKLLTKFIEYVDSFVTQRQVKFTSCDKFKQVFGELTLSQPQDLIALANVDLIFANLFINSDSSITQIDYEWIFDFTIPKQFIIWRSCVVFYWMYKHKYPLILSLTEILELVGVNNKEHQIYLNLDYKFQQYVHGDNFSYLLNHKVMQSQVAPLDNRIKKYPQHAHMQLFYYQNDEINSNDIIILPLKNEQQTKFSFDLSNIEQISHIRIDFTNFPVKVNLESVHLTTDNDKYLLTTPCYTNANQVNGNNYIYLHDDPINVYYLTPLNLTNIREVEVVVDLIPIKHSEIFELANSLTLNQKQQIEEINRSLNSKINELNSVQHELNNTQLELRDNQHQLNLVNIELSQVYNSSSWKLTKPLRELVKIIKVKSL